MLATADEAIGALGWLLRRRWAMTAARENARLLLSRLCHVGAGAAAAAQRRALAEGPAAQARRASCLERRGPRCDVGRRGLW